MSMAVLLHILGVWRAEERLSTFAAALATQSETLDKDRLLADVRKLKEFYDTLGPVEHRGPLEYPETPQEFQTKYPEIYMATYNGQSPVPSKWSNAYKCMVIGVTPCRNTRAGCTLGPSGSHSNFHSMESSTSLGSSDSQSSQQGGLPSLPGFQWCSPGPESVQLAGMQLLLRFCSRHFHRTC